MCCTHLQPPGSQAGGESHDVLQKLVDFDGYYLHGEDAFAVPKEPVYKAHKIESIQAETKYTENRILIRLADRYLIK